MPVNLYETAIAPVIDSDTGVVVYVPGYAKMGPSEPTLVTADTFTSIFGDAPYIFTSNQTCDDVPKNTTYKGRPDKSWLYAKGLVDAGLTVLYHRTNPCKVPYAEGDEPFILRVAPTTGAAVNVEESTIYNSELQDDVKLYVRAKYFGKYYSGLTVEITPANAFRGSMTVTVRDANKNVLESASIYFDPSKTNYIGNVTFSYIQFYLQVGNEDGSITNYFDGFDLLQLEDWYSTVTDSSSENPNKNFNQGVFVKNTVTLTSTFNSDEFNVNAFLDALSGTSSPFDELEDTEKYQDTTYITSGGYYQTTDIAASMQTLAFNIKAIALIDLPDEVNTGTLEGVRGSLTTLSSDTAAKAKSTMFVGADTYSLEGYRVVMPDSYGYLAKLGANMMQGIAYWIPVANNPQGVVSAVATTRPISNALKEMMVTNDGVSINPIIYKQNAGYTIMGNRTLFPTDGTAGPDSFLNCQLVVNAVLRSARRAANDLLIVSTNPNTAFSTFKLAVSRTCEKMLVNGDGLAAYNITKQKKSQPATIDILIELTVVEGIETFNINLEYQLDMSA